MFFISELGLINCKLKFVSFIAIFMFFSFGFGQNPIPLDSVKNYIIEDSILQEYVQSNKFIEVKNTSFGIVLYEPSHDLISFNETLDTLTELDGFESYDWKIISRDTVDGNLKVIASCSDAWGNSRSEFTFEKIQPNFILLKRVIYDEDGIEIIKYEKLILEKKFILDFVCLKEPTPDLPGTEIPFIYLDMNNMAVATREAFLNP